MFPQFRILALCTLIGLIALLGCQQSAQQPQQEAAAPPEPPSMVSPPVEDPVVATVNGEEIHQSDLIRQMNALASRGIRMSPEESIDQAIAERLFVQAASEAGQVVAASEVEKAYNEIVLREGSEANLQAKLAGAGMTSDGLKTELERQMRLQKVLGWKTEGKIEVSDASVEAYYEDNPQLFDLASARHILVLSRPGDPEEKQAEARGRIESIAGRLEAGEDFAEVARVESEDPGSAARGGDLGEFGRGRMVAPFEEAVFSLEPGQTSDIVQTQYGYHIIQLQERKILSLAEVQDRLRQALENRERDRVIGEWLEELKAKATIEMGGANEVPMPAMMGSGPKTDS